MPRKKKEEAPQVRLYENHGDYEKESAGEDGVEYVVADSPKKAKPKKEK